MVEYFIILYTLIMYGSFDAVTHIFSFIAFYVLILSRQEVIFQAAAKHGW
jgi:hypothetical protein